MPPRPLRWREVSREFTEFVVATEDGGSNGSRARLWKTELQALSGKIGRFFRVSPFPSGTSKWNKIEHRLFLSNSMDWKGIPLVSHEVVVTLIANAKTKTGFVVYAVLDTNSVRRESGSPTSK